MHKDGSHLCQKNGIYYFLRRIPKDVSQHYGSSRVVFSLRTRSPSAAAARAAEFASRLDRHWFNLRMQDEGLLSRYLVKSGPLTGVTPPYGAAPPASDAAKQQITLSDAVGRYLRLKGRGRPVTFQTGAQRVSDKLIAICGDKNVDEYTRTDANKFRDTLISEGLAGSSIARVIGSIKAILNFAANEMGETNNPAFTGLYIDRTAGTEDRKPISTKHLRIIQRKCREVDDEKRWLIALISDTGLRLAEAVGLLKSDFEVQQGIPVVIVRPHLWRRLKTPSSERVVPLVGTALWASQRVFSEQNKSKFAFPSYNRTNTSNANSASAALNKYLECQIAGCGTVHGFRHALRDRLRAVQAPSDLADQLGGWATPGIGTSYGRGYPVTVLYEWLKKIC